MHKNNHQIIGYSSVLTRKYVEVWTAERRSILSDNVVTLHRGSVSR